jgi:predicted PurR-regulated permease PerM
MDEKDLKKFMKFFVIILLALLSFLIIRPIGVPITVGLLLAYIFYPLYLNLKEKTKSGNISATIIVVGALVILLLPILILLPNFVKELLNAYLVFSNMDLASLILKSFPFLASSSAIATQVSSAASHFSTTLSEGMLSFFQNTIMSIPELMFATIIILFTFFFALREGEDFKEYFLALFPFGQEHEKRFLERFDQVTNSVVYGHLVIGLVQGLVAGIGYYIFGIPNALILTVLTAIAGILPVVGPWLVWIPVDLYLFASGNSVAGMQLLIFSLFATNWTDILLRPSVVAGKAEMNSAIALIGAIGGTYAFGVMGFILGPLFLAYFILLIELYKNKKTESILIKEEENKTT